MQPIQSIHHITAFAKNPQVNAHFYHHVLGQRLIKKTVNFDDPGTYHLYYSDEIGTPGTVMTFFPWPMVARGVAGNGEVGATAYAIRPESVDYWLARLRQHGVTVGEPQPRFGETVIPFHDPEGTALEFVVSDEPATIRFWADGPIPEVQALRGFYGATLWLATVEATAALLVEQLGFEFVGREANRYRFKGAANDTGLYLDLLVRPDLGPGRTGSGSVHHIAFRAHDDTEQLAYQRQLAAAGYRVTPVQDRQYFHSIYFRSPGGVLFEIATDAPGFAIDESVDQLGQSLKLPAWLEPQRDRIERGLPPLNLTADTITHKENRHD